ncbi:follistatin-related protein 3 [Neophocaena asiaeorientalis asiaeorientalis]|uniref:Follistatin-related protein 3 n=1 Tax=Neophocaena asiaeorientalis asiaeorientalis TaxID=1706337 RepID=A0A341B1U1_NEOAA|nr:follistatin-related protein 3 [Neophocaena asiaeorientalis asiaeorientalis]
MGRQLAGRPRPGCGEGHRRAPLATWELARLSAGGVCWLQQGREATCSLVLRTDVSQAECCASGNIDTAWSNFTHPGNKISLLGFLGLVHCLPCKGKLKLKHQLELRDGPPDPQATELGGPSGPAWSSHAEVPWLSPTHSCDRFPLLSWQIRVCVREAYWCNQRGEGLRVDLECGRGSWKGCGFWCNQGAASEGRTLRAGSRRGRGLWPRLGGAPLTLPDAPPAESCAHVVCLRPQSCVVDQTGSAHCVVCRAAPCPAPSSPGQELCGNNNVTYMSSCHLRQATCFLGRSIGVRHPGSCAGTPEPLDAESEEDEENFV